LKLKKKQNSLQQYSFIEKIKDIMDDGLCSWEAITFKLHVMYKKLLVLNIFSNTVFNQQSPKEKFMSVPILNSAAIFKFQQTHLMTLDNRKSDCQVC
jgi:hypothetical protein